MERNLHFLQSNHAGVLRTKDGRTKNYGVIRIENNNLIHYSGMGLREMWKPTMTDGEKKRAEQLKKLDEKTLIASEHIQVTPLDSIEIVHS